MAETHYVHGYTAREAARLTDQAMTLSDLLHEGLSYAAGRRVLEAGCGTGAQTVLLARQSPAARIHSIDRSAESVAAAQRRIAEAGYDNVEFAVADLFDLPFAPGYFDDLLVSFVLEHLPDPVGALRALLSMVRPGGSVTVIEGDHGSWYCRPQSKNASRAVQRLIGVQASLGGDGLIGRRLYPLLVEAGVASVAVTPRMVYVDDSRPHLVEGFSKKTFIAMVEGVCERALAMGMVDAATWEKGIADIYRATEPGGTFCYTFFRATGIHPAEPSTARR
jgi:SAM-dependent methyltransferase